jgi:hypothetical protein
MSNPFAPAAEASASSAPIAGYAWLPNRLRARVLMGALGVCVLLDAVAVLTGLTELVAPMEEGGIGLAIGVLNGFVALGQTLVFLATAVCWLLWQYRASWNTFAAGYSGDITPGWSIAYWFIPIANLFRPYKAIETIWGESGARRSLLQEPGGILGLWWAVWVISNLSANFTVRVFGFEVSSEATIAWAFSDATSAVAAVLAILVVKGVDETQAALAAERGFAH